MDAALFKRSVLCLSVSLAVCLCLSSLYPLLVHRSSFVLFLCCVQVNVYGVKLPFSDGRIGMAALVPITNAMGVHVNQHVPEHRDTHALAHAHGHAQSASPPVSCTYTYELDNDVILKPLLSHLSHRLPSYARPAFLRVCHGVNVTITFKHQKVDCSSVCRSFVCFCVVSVLTLFRVYVCVCTPVQMHLQAAGFDLSKTGDDAVYYMSAQHPQQFKRLTRDALRDIEAGNIRF